MPLNSMNILELIPYLNIIIIPILLFALKSKVRDIVASELDGHLKENHEFHVKQQDLMNGISQRLAVIETKSNETSNQIHNLHDSMEKMNDRIISFIERNSK